MIASITFSELSEYVAAHYKQNVTFEAVSDNKLKLSLWKKILFKNVSIDITLGIERFSGAGLVLSYESGFGVDMMITGALVFFKSKLAEYAEAVKIEENNRIYVNLSNIPQAKALTDAMSLEEIRICNDGLEIKAMLK